MKDRLGRYLLARRIDVVLPKVRGSLLDVGCGSNQLVRRYRQERGERVAVGVDVHPWPGVDRVVEDSADLPFPDGSYDTVTIVAALNHIADRERTLAEVFRVLREDGRLLVTMIPPGISRLWHFLRSPWDADQAERGMVEGELFGMTRAQVDRLLLDAGFRLREHERFMLGVNCLTVAEKPGSGEPGMGAA